MSVGTEWLIDAENCSADLLRDLTRLRALFARIIDDLGLKTIGDGTWHQFDGEGGITGLVMLTESHLACHTYPEHRLATFNLYCCRSRPEWDWESNLAELLGAEKVSVTCLGRGETRTAGDPPAVVSVSRAQNLDNEQLHSDRGLENTRFVRYGQVKIRNRGRLPHWETEDGIYFVTFRLADSLPQHLLRQIEAERDQALRVVEKLERGLTLEEKRKIDWIFSEKVDEYLDQGIGNCELKRPDVAQIVVDSLKYFDDQRYHLFAWCIMPNHVHVVFRAIQRNKLENILHSWKSFTAHEINKLLNRTGTFWQREYYDRLVRDQDEFNRTIEYVVDNPTKANLKNWQWVWAYGKFSRAANS